jgi:hypothetical protein
MIIKKVIGIVVCGVFLLGDSGTGVVASQRMPESITFNSQDEIRQIKDDIIRIGKEISELREQLVASIQGNPSPFTSLQSVKKYIKRITDDDENPESLTQELVEHLQKRVESTVAYFTQGRGREIKPPEGVVGGDWPGCKCIEILHMIKQKIPSVVTFCQNKISEYSGNVVIYAKLLLMSQCCTWNELAREYELDSCANEMIVKDAIRMLYGITLLPEKIPNEMVNDVKQLLNAIKNKNGFRDYC